MNDKEGIETAQYLGRMIIDTIRATENLRKAAPSS